MTIVFTIGMVGFLLLASEDDIYNPMPILKWLVIKGIGLTLFVLCFALGKYLNRKGLLPDFEEE